MKSKLKLVEMFNSSKSNQNNVCVVVMLTMITKPTWSHVPCNNKFSDNYFLCETRFSNKTATTYYRHNQQCHKLHTYYLEKCWLIQPDNDRTLVIETSTIYQTFYVMLSAWAYGHTSRNHVHVYVGNVTNVVCISTDGLPSHFGKTWISFPCNPNDVSDKFHKLGQVYPTTYSYICNGNLQFTCMDNTCILSSYLCDNIYDCPDKSDEHNDVCAESDIQEGGCGDFHFHCRTGSCIHATQQCDSWQHCDDGSDEEFCVDIEAGIHNGDLNTDTVQPYLIQVI